MMRYFFLLPALGIASWLQAQTVNLCGTWIPSRPCGIRQITMNEDSSAVIELEKMTLGTGESSSGLGEMLDSPTRVTFTADMSQHPKWITYTVTQVNTGEQSEMQGIFMTLSEDRIKMHIRFEEGPRPDSFVPVTSPDIVVLQRKVATQH